MKKLIVSFIFLCLSCSAAFSQSIDVSRPRHKEIYKAGQSMTVAWTASMITGNVRIKLERVPLTRGGSFHLLSNVSPGQSSMQVTIPQNVQAGTYRVRIEQILSPYHSGHTADFFVNALNCGLNISLPNGYSNYTWGSQKEIRWVRVGIASDLKCSLVLLKGNTLVANIAKQISGTSYMWSVPQLPTGKNYRVKVYVDPGGLSSQFGGNSNLLYRIGQKFRIGSTLADLWTYNMRIINPKPNQKTNTAKIVLSIKNLSKYYPSQMSKAILKIKKGGFKDKLYLDIPEISPQQIKEKEIDYDFPKTGAYRLILNLNYDQSFQESDYSNNKKAQTRHVKLLPDLLAYLHISDHTPRITKKTTFTVVVKNVGKSAAKPAEMKFYLKGKWKDKLTIPGLKPGQKYHIQRKARFATRGTKRYHVRVDTKNQVRELNKQNNVIKGSIKVLLPTDFDKGGFPLNSDIVPEIITNGNAKKNQYYHYKVKLTNNGKKKSTPSDIRLTVSGKDPYNNPMLGEMYPGETRTYNFSVKWTSAGSKKIKVHVDPNEKIPGEIKYNNKTEVSVQVNN